LTDLTLPLPAEDREVPETDAVTAAAAAVAGAEAAAAVAGAEAAVDAITPPDPAAANDDGAAPPSFTGRDGFDPDRLLLLFFWFFWLLELDSFGAAPKSFDFRDDEAFAVSPIDSFAIGVVEEEEAAEPD